MIKCFSLFKRNKNRKPEVEDNSVPSYTVAMQGKVLAIADDGTLEWVDVKNLLQK